MFSGVCSDWIEGTGRWHGDNCCSMILALVDWIQHMVSGVCSDKMERTGIWHCGSCCSAILGI